MFIRALSVAVVVLLTAVGAVGVAPAASSSQTLSAFTAGQRYGTNGAVDTDAEHGRLYWLVPDDAAYRVEFADDDQPAQVMGTLGLDPATWRVKIVASDAGVYYLAYRLDGGAVTVGFLDERGASAGETSTAVPAGYTRVALTGDAEGSQALLVASAVNPSTADAHTLTWTSIDHGTSFAAGELALTDRNPAADAVPSVAVSMAGRAAIAWTTGSEQSAGLAAALRPRPTDAWEQHTLKAPPSAQSPAWPRASDAALGWAQSSYLAVTWLQADPDTGRTALMRSLWTAGTKTWHNSVAMEAAALTLDDTALPLAYARRRSGEILAVGTKFLVNAFDGSGWVRYSTSIEPGDVVGGDGGWLYLGPTTAPAQSPVTPAAAPAWVTGGPDLGSYDPWKAAPFDPDGPLIDIAANAGRNYIVGSRRALFRVYANVLDPARLSEDVLYQRQFRAGIGRLGDKYRTGWSHHRWGAENLRPFETMCGRGRARFSDRSPTKWTRWTCVSAPADDRELAHVRGRVTHRPDRLAYQDTLTVLHSRRAMLRGIKITAAVDELSVRVKTGRRSGKLAVFVGKTRLAKLNLRRPSIRTKSWHIATRGATGRVRLVATSGKEVAVDWLATLASR